MIDFNDTIAAICTPLGSGALGVIRVSGAQAIDIVNQLFRPKDLTKAKGYSLHFGRIYKDNEVLDEVLVTVFRAPRSFTKENVVEISCHGSAFILRECLQLLVDEGARLAKPGEFTQRAFLNGAMDLSQAEAVADLIASNSAAAHQIAMKQLRGGISRELKNLREQLLNFTSLIELELDFSEEDVEFADRTQLFELVQRILIRLEQLIRSFSLGNAIKQGVPTVIMGKPNAGKSTLLNALLNENRAIVSNIPGTTRDVIEDRIVIEGIEFRLMDTAGIRETTDIIEAEGVNRTLAIARNASLAIYIFDIHTDTPETARLQIAEVGLPESTHLLLVGNKIDLEQTDNQSSDDEVLYISAKEGNHLEHLRKAMVSSVQHFSTTTADNAIISNVRHLHALRKAYAALEDVQNGLEIGLTGDFLSIDIRTAIHHIGEITGQITTDEVLGNIFSKFCIGK